MSKKTHDPRERAARALCRLAKVPEDTQFEGAAMWESFLDDVDAVLEAVGWSHIRQDLDKDSDTDGNA